MLLATIRIGNPVGVRQAVLTLVAGVTVLGASICWSQDAPAEPFFPLGLFFGQIAQEDVRAVADSPFNCIMPYSEPTPTEMDLAHAAGVKVIYSLKDHFAGSRWSPPHIKTEADELVSVEAIVREFRDHPALLAWYLSDERPPDLAPRILAHYELVRSLDPDHLSWIVTDLPSEAARFRDSCDVIGSDPYPIGNGLPLTTAAEWTRLTREGTEGELPLWQVPQTHNLQNYALGMPEWNRTPQTNEIRCMAWMCLAEGANGLIFYSYFDLERNPGPSFEAQWQGLKEVAGELAELRRFFVSGAPAPAHRFDIVAGDESAIVVAAFAAGDEVLAVLINGAERPARAIWRLGEPGRPKGEAVAIDAGPLDVSWKVVGLE